VTVKNSVVSGNKAKGTVEGKGGGIYSFNSVLAFLASTVRGNKATTSDDDIFSGP
jgi:hypothetical protein